MNKLWASISSKTLTWVTAAVAAVFTWAHNITCEQLVEFQSKIPTSVTLTSILAFVASMAYGYWRSKQAYQVK